QSNRQSHIRLGSHDQDVHDASINDQIRDLCGQVGLEDAVLERSPGQLSGGMRMRVSIARALITRPSLLLMDEPFAALDDMLRNRLCELIQSLWYEHAFTTVLVTHNISEAVFISRRVAVMTGDGSIGKILTIDEPMPRDDGFRSRPEFGEYYGRLAAALRDA
ncbi:MAG: ATP-binding cassette domain-containing protein, partial [Planctomycetota bacterium]